MCIASPMLTITIYYIYKRGSSGGSKVVLRSHQNMHKVVELVHFFLVQNISENVENYIFFRENFLFSPSILFLMKYSEETSTAKLF